MMMCIHVESEFNTEIERKKRRILAKKGVIIIFTNNEWESIVFIDKYVINNK